MSKRSAMLRGARETPALAACVLFATFLGFGTLTSETGLSWLDTLFMSLFIFALPGQVVLVDEISRGASVLTAAIAVAATGVRLLPMTVALLPVVRDRNTPKWQEFLVAHFVAVTVWVEAMRRAPDVPPHLRVAYILGIGFWLVFASGSGAMVGFALAARVPDIAAAALLMTTPLYFLLAMLLTARTRDTVLPILFGLALGPLFHLAMPQFDLLLTGLVGGTLSFALTRKRQVPGGEKD